MDGPVHTIEIELEPSAGRRPSDRLPAPESTKKPKRGAWVRVGLILGAIGITLILASIWILPRLFPKPPHEIVIASGRIEGREVTLAPKEVQGRVKILRVDEGYSVKKGQLLAELESDQLEARYASLAANLSNVDVQLRQASIDVAYTTKNTSSSIAAAEAAVSSAKAHLTHATAVLTNASADYQRALGLYRDQVVAKNALDQATMQYETSRADVNAAEKDQAQAEANLAVAQSTRDVVDLKIQQLHALQQTRHAAEAQLAEARANLAELSIYAPTDGTILSRTVEVGDVVSPGSPIFVMVDMNRLYLKVYIPEPDIPKLKLGDPADISVDAFPGRTFPARITRIHQEAEFTPKNVETKEERVKLVFGVELTFTKPEGLLKPGMPADCSIHWKESTNLPGSK